MVTEFIRIPLITHAFLSREKGIMAYSALDIAKYVINYEHSQGREVSNLRLQKLLYFIQAKVLMETGEPCFEDEMQAWDFGPVVPSVYYKYKIFGAMDIFTREVETTNIASNIIGFISSILEYCRTYPTYQLVEITHQQDPWKFARARGSKAIISTNSIKEYFLSKNQ